MKSNEKTFRISTAIVFLLAAVNQLVILFTSLINQLEYIIKVGNFEEIMRVIENLSYTFIPFVLLVAVAIILFLGQDKILTYGLIAISGLFLIFQLKRSFGNITNLGSDIDTFFRIMNYILLPLATAVLLLGMSVCSAFLKEKVPAFIPMLLGFFAAFCMVLYDINYVILSFNGGFLARAIGKYSKYDSSFYELRIADYIYFIFDILFFITLAAGIALLGVYLTKRMKSTDEQ